MKRIKSIKKDQEAFGGLVYRVDITQFELTKMLYESEFFSKIELTASAKLFLWALCSHYNPKNETMFPSQLTVSKRLGMSERSAERAVKELRDKGLVTYTTKRVNHYVFSEMFFKLIGLKENVQPVKTLPLPLHLAESADEKDNKIPDKMSDNVRQNVGCEPRQNVGLTNKHEQKKKINFQNSFLGENGTAVKVYSRTGVSGAAEIKYGEKQNNAGSNRFCGYKYNGGQQKYFQPGGKAIPSIEETQKLIREREKIREIGFNPMDYSRQEAVAWLEKADLAWLRHSRVARFLIEKYKLKKFQYVLDFGVKSFDEA